METNDARRDLAEAERLAGVTRREALRTPVWAMPLMSVALVGFFVVFSKLDHDARLYAAMAWTSFVLLWVLAIRRGTRAKLRRRARTKHQQRRDFTEWMALLVSANAVTFAFSRVSWALVGVGLALLGTAFGSLSAWRATRP